MAEKAFLSVFFCFLDGFLGALTSSALSVGNFERCNSAALASGKAGGGGRRGIAAW